MKKQKPWVIWKNKDGSVNRIQFINYEAAKTFCDNLEDFKIKEISQDEYGVACGLYKLPLNPNLNLAC